MATQSPAGRAITQQGAKEIAETIANGFIDLIKEARENPALPLNEIREMFAAHAETHFGAMLANLDTQNANARDRLFEMIASHFDEREDNFTGREAAAFIRRLKTGPLQ